MVKQEYVYPRTYIFLDFDAYKRNLAKWLCTFENIAACRNKASQMRDRILLGILRMQEYMRSCGRCLATGSHKKVKENARQ